MFEESLRLIRLLLTRERVSFQGEFFTVDGAHVGPLPASKQGFVTFSSFNYRPKITLQTITVWAKILQRVPNSRLVLKNRVFLGSITHLRYNQKDYGGFA